MAYLCVQPASPGQAAYSHMQGITGGLQELGWNVQTYATEAPRAGLIARSFDALGLQLRLAVHLARHRPEWVYVRWHPWSFVAVAMARFLRLNVALEVNGPTDDLVAAWPQLRRLEGLMSASLKFQLARSDVAFTVTRGLRAWLRELHHGSSVELVANAADPRVFAPSNATPFEKRTDALFFGSLAPWQGVNCLLDAVDDPAWPEYVRLVIAGDGLMRADVERAARTRPDRVRYLGQLTPSEVADRIRESAVVLIPKIYDRVDLGLSPLKLYEALACGRPVIVSDLEGLADPVRAAAAGIVVASAPEPSEVAQAVRRLMEEPGLRGEFEANAMESSTDHTWHARAQATADALAGG